MPGPAATLLDLLGERARTEPHDPWLFYPEGPTWRWLSWREAWRVAERLLAAPNSGEDAAVPAPGTGSPALALVAHLVERSRRAAPGQDERLIRGAAEWIDDTPGRPVRVAWRPPQEPGEEWLLAWSLTAKAAVLYESDPAAIAATALWARPTHLATTAAELSALLAAWLRLTGGRQPMHRLRRRLGRLRTLWLVGDERPTDDLLEPLAELGLAPTAMPQSG